MRFQQTVACSWAAVAACALAVPAGAVPLMDGFADTEYGAPLSTQDTNTQFGNGTNGDPINGGGGSEIDRIFAKVVDDGTGVRRLYVLMAGNLETNFNKLEVFIDSTPTGVNTIVGADQPTQVDGYCCKQPDPINLPNPTSGALQRMNGLTFDAGFTADYYLTINHGFEGNIDGTGTGTSDGLRLYAASAHYAKLSDPANGIVGAGQALGIQLAQRGLPQVLRGTTADFDVDGDADGQDFMIWQRNAGATGANRKLGDASGNGIVDDEDLTTWKSAYGFDNDTASFNADFFAPQSAGLDNSNSLLGPTLQDLARGQLIDKAYAAAHAGLTPELNIVMPVISPENTENRRDMLNSVQLQMAIDNSNVLGVTGTDPYTDVIPPETVGPVNTGIEFSIPLSHIGNPTAPIKLLLFVNGGEHNYASNQFSGDGINDGNPGGNGFGGSTPEFDLSGVDLTDYEGNQFVSVPVAILPATNAVPEPATCVLIGLATGAVAVTRRRRIVYSATR